MLKNILNKLVPGVNNEEATMLPSYDQRSAANLKARDKFSPLGVKLLGASVEIDRNTQTVPFNLSIMDDRTLPSRILHRKPR